MLIEMFAVAVAAVIAGEVEFFAAQPKIKILVQSVAKFGQKAGEGEGIERRGLKIDPADAVAANIGVFVPACVFPDGGFVKLAGFPECLA